MENLTIIMKRNLYLNTAIQKEIKRIAPIKATLIVKKGIRPSYLFENLVNIGLAAYPKCDLEVMNDIISEMVQIVPLKKILLTNENDLYDMFADSIADYQINQKEEIWECSDKCGEIESPVINVTVYFKDENKEEYNELTDLDIDDDIEEYIKDLIEDNGWQDVADYDWSYYCPECLNLAYSF